MNQRYESKWAMSWKALLYDLMAGFRDALFDAEQLRKEWLCLVGQQFHTSQLRLFHRDRQTQPTCADEQELALIKAVDAPYLLYKEEISKGPGLYNLGFRLSGFCKEKQLYLLLNADEELLSDLTEEDLLFFAEESSRLIQWAKDRQEIEGRVNRYKDLFDATGKLHSSTDIEFVLKEIIAALEKAFPLYSYHFLMAMERSYTGLPVSHFNFDDVSEEGMASYTKGTIEVDDICSILYAPLIGKQGVYGVLKVNFAKEGQLPEMKKEFIRMLAAAGGGAIEKVMLYEQSRQLNADLQLINDASHKLNSSLRFSDVLSFLHAQITHSFRACEVGFIFLNGAETDIISGSSSFFLEAEGQELIRFTANQLRKEKEAFFIGELEGKLEGVLPTFHAMMAVPMEQGTELNGFCIVLRREPYSFTFEMYKLLQSLIHHSTLALANAMLREKLEKMVITDHLTKLYSRGYLDRSLQKSLEKDEKGVFLLVDIDNFKKVNDTYGHQVGDEILIQVAQIMKAAIGKEDMAARWGGEELAVYFPNCSLEEGVATAETMIAKIAANTTPAVTVSCGLSFWSNENPPSKKQLFNYADAALYEAKEAGKNRITVGHYCK